MTRVVKVAKDSGTNVFTRGMEHALSTIHQAADQLLSISTWSE